MIKYVLQHHWFRLRNLHESKLQAVPRWPASCVDPPCVFSARQDCTDSGEQLRGTQGMEEQPISGVAKVFNTQNHAKMTAFRFSTKSTI